MSDDLLALSSVDGRYASETEALRSYFSEFAYIRDRVRVEIAYLLVLSEKLKILRPMSAAEHEFLRLLDENFSTEDCQQVKSIEAATRHDVKAIEEFLRERLSRTTLADAVEMIHFGLTSEDVNSIAQATALKESRDQILLPAIDEILSCLTGLTRANITTAMLARTHGQPAVATTFGKELAVFLERLRKQVVRLASHTFSAKLTGAVGNFNAAHAAIPQVDWLAFSNRFVKGFGLEPELFTTQILSYDNWTVYFNHLHLLNSILLDLTQDLWRYISDDYLILRAMPQEAGSSTMPQKINPIDFENAEGNLSLANGFIETYARKLPVSRLQRDLSDSTIRRSFGTALGHSLVAYKAITRGLARLEANPQAMSADLERHWEVIAEGAQSILRAAGVPGAYDQLKAVTRGKGLTKESYSQWVEGLTVTEVIKSNLRALSPSTYIGLAAEIARRVLDNPH